MRNRRYEATHIYYPLHRKKTVIMYKVRRWSENGRLTLITMALLIGCRLHIRVYPVPPMHLLYE